MRDARSVYQPLLSGGAIHSQSLELRLLTLQQESHKWGIQAAFLLTVARLYVVVVVRITLYPN
jgi:hypothetical protein